MNHYYVEWRIDLAANSAREAAEQALAIQRDVFSTATVFHVLPVPESDDTDDFIIVDLGEKEDEE